MGDIVASEFAGLNDTDRSYGETKGTWARDVTAV